MQRLSAVAVLASLLATGCTYLAPVGGAALGATAGAIGDTGDRGTGAEFGAGIGAVVGLIAGILIDKYYLTCPNDVGAWPFCGYTMNN